MADPERTRLVVLGDAGVGKSAICKRFLYNSFCPKYKMTVEDLYSKEFNVGTAHQLKVSARRQCKRNLNVGHFAGASSGKRKGVKVGRYTPDF